MVVIDRGVDVAGGDGSVGDGRLVVGGGGGGGVVVVFMLLSCCDVVLCFAAVFVTDGEGFCTSAASSLLNNN